MKAPELQRIATLLHRADLEAQEVERFTKTNPAFTLQDGYQVQSKLFALHKAAGEKLVGWKVGFTSRPKMLQMGVFSPIRGFLTGKMQIPDGGAIKAQGRIHPKVEPEIAFVMGREISGHPSVAEALHSVAGVCAALEVIDSRYRNFEFELPDVVADNCSSSGFVLGGILRRPGALDLGNIGIVLEVDGRAVQFGSSAAILGHPGRALADLVALLDEQGTSLKEGDIVLAGAATAAVAVAPGQWVRASMQGLGTVEARVTE